MQVKPVVIHQSHNFVVKGLEDIQEEYEPSDLKQPTNGRSDLTGTNEKASVALQDDILSKK